MGREARKAAGNPWYEARKKAAEYDDRLCSREGAAELSTKSSTTPERQMPWQTASLKTEKMSTKTGKPVSSMSIRREDTSWRSITKTGKIGYVPRPQALLPLSSKSMGQK